MKSLIAFVSLFIFWSFNSNAQNSKIEIRIINLAGLEGQVSIGLFSNPESFPKKEDGQLGVFLEIQDSVVQYTFENLNDGFYAIAVYHDENSNNEFDRSFLGWPVEDYVFSNYAEGSFGPPSFEDSSFELRDSVYIELEFK
jgi:uncharacterized protein (DUF2141 family)